MPRYLLTLVLCVLAAGCQFGGKKRPVGTVDEPLDDARSLNYVEIVNPVGTIDVRGSDPQHAPGVSAEVLLDERRPETDFVANFGAHVSVSREGDRLRIGSAHASASDRSDWQLRMTVYLPEGVALKLRQDAGTVEVAMPRTRGVDVDVDTGTVAVDVPLVEGGVIVDVETGRISVATTGAMPAGDCRLSCDTGTVTLSLPEEAGGELDLATDCGSIDVPSRFGVRIRRNVTEASCRGSFGKSGPKIHARVDTGSIKVR